jgi:hypothetical protein
VSNVKAIKLVYQVRLASRAQLGVNGASRRRG